MTKDIELSVIIGFKDWGLPRLLLSIASIHEAFGDCNGEIVVSDFGSADGETLRVAVEAAGAVYHRTDTDGTWSRSRAINAGYNVAKGDILIATDADMLFSPGSLQVVHSYIANDRNLAIVLQCRDLPFDYSHEHLEHDLLDWNQLEAVGQLRPRWGMGGMFAAARERVLWVGGYDNRMHTYGGEDLDFAQRIRRSGSPVVWIDDSRVRMYHIWHPATIRTVDKSDTEKAAVAANRAILKTDITWKRNRDGGTWDIQQSPPCVSIIIGLDAADPSECLRALASQRDISFEVLVVTTSALDESTLSRLAPEVSIRQILCGSHLSRGVEEALTIASAPFVTMLDSSMLLSPLSLASIFGRMNATTAVSWRPFVHCESRNTDPLATVLSPCREQDGTFILRGPGTGEGALCLFSTKIVRAFPISGNSIITILGTLLTRIEISGGLVEFGGEYAGLAYSSEDGQDDSRALDVDWPESVMGKVGAPGWQTVDKVPTVVFPNGVDATTFVGPLAPSFYYRTDVEFSTGPQGLGRADVDLPENAMWTRVKDLEGNVTEFVARVPDVGTEWLASLKRLDVPLIVRTRPRSLAQPGVGPPVPAIRDVAIQSILELMADVSDPIHEGMWNVIVGEGRVPNATEFEGGTLQERQFFRSFESDVEKLWVSLDSRAALSIDPWELASALPSEARVISMGTVAPTSQLALRQMVTNSSAGELASDED